MTPSDDDLLRVDMAEIQLSRPRDTRGAPRTSRHRHYWAVGVMMTLLGANMAVVLGSLLNLP